MCAIYLIGTGTFFILFKYSGHPFSPLLSPHFTDGSPPSFTVNGRHQSGCLHLPVAEPAGPAWPFTPLSSFSPVSVFLVGQKGLCVSPPGFFVLSLPRFSEPLVICSPSWRRLLGPSNTTRTCSGHCYLKHVHTHTRAFTHVPPSRIH